MFGIRKTGFCAVLALLILSGCLPDGNSTPKEAKSEQTKTQSSNLAASLSTIAMQMQTSIVSDDAMYAGIKSNSWEINLGTLAFPALGTDKVIYATADAVAQTKAFLCPLDATETQFKQIAWIDSRDASGNFSLIGMGTETGPLLNALNSKLSSDQVGTFKAGQITLSNGNLVNIPAGCGAASRIPPNAPVVVFTIEKPTPPAQDIVRTEYQTIPCTSASVGGQMQSRTVTLTSSGLRTETSWVNIGDGCATPISVADGGFTDGGFTDGVKQAITNVTSNGLGGNAAQQLQAQLAQSLTIKCVESKTTKTTKQQQSGDYREREESSSSNVSVDSSINTCDAAQNIQTETEEAENGTGINKTEVLTTACSSAGLANTASFNYLGFTGNMVYSNWNGAIQLRRNVSVSTNKTATQGDTTGAWYGETLSCNRTEILTLDCGQYYNNALNARNGGNNALEYQGDSSPYVIGRWGYLNGFSNPATLLPNAPTNSTWGLLGGSCRWTEREKITPSGCTYPNEFADEGEQVRTVTIDVNGNPSYSPWTITVPARCVAGCDAWSEVQAPVGSCRGPSRNWSCSVNFDLSTFVDFSANRNIYVKGFGYNNDAMTIFNSANSHSYTVNVGGRKGYSNEFRYDPGNRVVTINGHAWGWKDCNPCSGFVATNGNTPSVTGWGASWMPYGNPLTIGYTTRVKCGTSNTCQQTSESYAGACPTGMDDIRPIVCDEYSTNTQVDENGNTSTVTYCSKPRCLRSETVLGWDESLSQAVPYTVCTLYDRGGQPVNYNRTLNLLSICGNNTDWSPDQTMVDTNCAFPPAVDTNGGGGG